MKIKNHIFLTFILSLAFIFIAILATIAYLFTFYTPFQVKGRSMEPTLKNDTYLYSKKVSVGTSIKRGDIVVIEYPKNPETRFIERVIALPGESLKLSNGKVYVNDSILDEPYLKNGIKTEEGETIKEGQEYKLDENSFIVMGDNRSFSNDSRNWGYLNRKNILARYSFCYYNCK